MIIKYGDKFSFDSHSYDCNCNLCDVVSFNKKITSLDSIIFLANIQETKSREIHNIPPIEFTEGTIYYSSFNIPYLKVLAKNIDNIPVDAIELQLQAFNRFNEPVKDIFYQSNKSKILIQETINPEQEGGYMNSYLISLNSNVSRIKVILLRVRRKDGSVWKPKLSQQISFWVDSPK